MAAVAAVALLPGCVTAEEPDTPSTLPAPTQHTAADTRDERSLYRHAVRQVEAFDAGNHPLLAAGLATPRAKRFSRHHLRDWESAYATLRAHQAQGVRIARGPIVLRTEPVSVTYENRTWRIASLETTGVTCTG